MKIEWTLERTFRIWWALCWRNLLAIIGAWFAVAISGDLTAIGFGLLLELAGMEGEALVRAINLLHIALIAAMALFASFIILDKVLSRDFREFRIALVERTSDAVVRERPGGKVIDRHVKPA